MLKKKILTVVKLHFYTLEITTKIIGRNIMVANFFFRYLFRIRLYIFEIVTCNGKAKVSCFHSKGKLPGICIKTNMLRNSNGA